MSEPVATFSAPAEDVWAGLTMRRWLETWDKVPWRNRTALALVEIATSSRAKVDHRLSALQMISDMIRLDYFPLELVAGRPPEWFASLTCGVMLTIVVDGRRPWFFRRRTDRRNEQRLRAARSMILTAAQFWQPPVVSPHETGLLS